MPIPPYAQVSDLMVAYDTTRLGDLVTDGGPRVPASQLPTNLILQAMLLQASGMIDAACQRGQKYTQTDLLNIANGGDPLNPSMNMQPSQALLTRLVCDLAYGLLVGRRGYSAADSQAESPRYAEARSLLESLSAGEMIFVTAGTLAAGIPNSQINLSSQIGLLSGAARRYFGDLVADPRNYRGGGSGTTGGPF